MTSKKRRLGAAFPPVWGIIGTTMKSAISAALALSALIGALAMPSKASAVSQGRSYDLATEISAPTVGVGASSGALTLHVAGDGIISGYYRSSTNGQIVPVTGGLVADRVWLDIGTPFGTAMRFRGTFSAGKIDAQGSTVFLSGGRYASLELVGTIKLDEPSTR